MYIALGYIYIKGSLMNSKHLVLWRQNVLISVTRIFDLNDSKPMYPIKQSICLDDSETLAHHLNNGIRTIIQGPNKFIKDPLI